MNSSSFAEGVEMTQELNEAHTIESLRLCENALHSDSHTQTHTQYHYDTI